MFDGGNSNFYKLATHSMLRKFKKHVELFTGIHNRKTPQKTLQYEHTIEQGWGTCLVLRAA